MKRLIILMLLTFGAKAYGQVYQLMPQYGYDAKRMKFDSTLQIPTVCGEPTLKSNILKYGAIAFDSCNKRFYAYDPKDATWAEVSGGGGGSTDTTSLSNRIDQKVPYTGAINDLDMGEFDVAAHKMRITGQNGQGKLDMRKQSSNSTTSANSSALYADVNGNFSWQNDNIRYFKLTNNHFTANHPFRLPDTTGTIALLQNVDTRLKISDTSSMLTPYLRKADTTSLSNRINTKLNISDTSSMLSPYLRKADTLSLSNRINLKLNISDTSSMLSPYLRKADTLSLSNRINSKLSITDTSVFLRDSDSSLYQTKFRSDTSRSNIYTSLATKLTGTDTISLSNRINSKLSISDTSVFLRDSDSALYQTKYGVDTMRVNVYNAIASSGGSTDTTSLSNRINTKLNISDTSVFLRDSFPSYTFYANNTTATAPALPTTFKDTSGAFTGALTWTGTTAPSGATDHTFRYTQIGKMVSVSITLVYGSAGSTLTAVQMELPSYFPTPVTPSGLSGNSSILYMGSAHMSNGLTVSTNIHRGHLRTNSTNTGYEFFIQTATAGNYRYAELNIFYFIP